MRCEVNAHTSRCAIRSLLTSDIICSPGTPSRHLNVQPLRQALPYADSLFFARNRK